MVRHLLELGVRPNQPDCQGYTALHWAVQAGNLEAAKALIAAGEDLHARHALTIPGMSPEESAQQAQMIAGMMSGGIEGYLKEMGLDDEDLPPLPETSTPMGEKLADLMEGFGAMKQRVEEQMSAKLAERAAGSWGQGESAALVACPVAAGTGNPACARSVRRPASLQGGRAPASHGRARETLRAKATYPMRA